MRVCPLLVPRCDFAVAISQYHRFCLPTITYLLFVSRPAWQIVDALYFAVIEMQYGRKLSPAAVVNPLLGCRESSEPREAGQYAGAYGDLSDDSPGGFTAERHNFRSARSDIDEAAFATQGSVGIGGPGVQEQDRQHGRSAHNSVHNNEYRQRGNNVFRIMSIHGKIYSARDAMQDAGVYWDTHTSF